MVMTHQYLIFLLDGELFAINILRVKEIIEYSGLTGVPMMPACMRGVINLRGAAVPVIDLLPRFGKAPSAVTKRTCIVILESDAEHDIGVVVDAVNAVIDIAPAQIEPPPSFGARARNDCIEGMGKVDGKFVVILNIDAATIAPEALELELAGVLAHEAGEVAAA